MNDAIQPYSKSKHSQNKTQAEVLREGVKELLIILRSIIIDATIYKA